jgi:hypothetical protein
MRVNDAKNTQDIPGISSALDVPVTQGKKEGESALFRGVAKRNGTAVPMDMRRFAAERTAPLW